jgi:O-acetyl-ADP-ribose deacetylase (regulator of RNase III)
MPRVFINYRVQDQAGYATLVYRELVRRFGEESLFFASRSIRSGEDFVLELFARLRECDVLLAVIGPHWAAHGGRDRRAGGVDFDWVHQEIAEAFASGVRVIPVLVENAELPDKSLLPSEISALARCQSMRLRHDSIDADLDRLVTELRSASAALNRRSDEDTTAVGRPAVFRVAGEPRPACRIAVVPGDIRRVRFADIWVNSENTDMQMARVTEFSTSAIIRYWGSIRDDTGHVVRDVIAEELAERVRTSRPVAPGTTIVTGGGALTESNGVRHIIHVAAVRGEPGAGFRQVSDVGWCVTNVLGRAVRLARADPTLRTILFPLLGTGMAGAPVEPTADAMLSAAVDHVVHEPETPLRTIYFLAYSERERRVFNRAVHYASLAPLLDTTVE